MPTEVEPSGLLEPERWLLSRFTYTASYVNDRIDRFRFDEACQRLYDFFWKELCDWSIEFAKPVFNGESDRPRVTEVLLWTLDHSLRLLHPVMPHLTEELWQKLPRTDGTGDGEENFIALVEYPDPPPAWRDAELEQAMECLQETIGRLRAFRKERNLARDIRVSLFIEGGEHREFVTESAPLIRFLAQVADVTLGPGPESCVRDRVAGLDLAIESEVPPLTDIDRERLEKELAGIAKEIAGAEHRLSNPGFLERAPAHVVEGSRHRLVELKERQTKIGAELA